MKTLHDASMKKKGRPSLCLDIKPSFRPRLMGEMTERMSEHREDIHLKAHQNNLLMQGRSLDSQDGKTPASPGRRQVSFLLFSIICADI